MDPIMDPTDAMTSQVQAMQAETAMNEPAATTDTATIPAPTVRLPEALDEVTAFLGTLDPNDEIYLNDSSSCLGARLMGALNPGFSFVTHAWTDGHLYTNDVASIAAGVHIHNYAFPAGAVSDFFETVHDIASHGGSDAIRTPGELTALVAAFQSDGKDAVLALAREQLDTRLDEEPDADYVNDNESDDEDEFDADADSDADDPIVGA